VIQLETRAAALARRLASESPELFSHPQPVFSWEMVPLDTPEVDWDDRSTHKVLTCVNHPKARYSTKNPYDRSLFCHKGLSGGDMMFDQECSCSFADLRVAVKR
jgi:hypothetical protein